MVSRGMSQPIQQPEKKSTSFLGRCALRLERHEYAALAALLAVTAAAELRQSSGKPLWYDEMFTVGQTLQPGLHRMMQGAVLDGNPPTYALLCKLLVHLFGHADIVFRLPSIAAFALATLVLYALLRTRVSAVAALAAAAFLSNWPVLAGYAIEARPYALLLLFTAVAYLGWLLASDRGRYRRLGLWLVPIGIAGAVLSHHLGIMNTLLPLSAGVLAQTIQRRRLDAPLCLAAILGASTQLLTLPLIHRSHQAFLRLGGSVAPVQVVLGDYERLLAAPLLVAALLFCAKLFPASPRKRMADISPLLLASYASIALPLLLCTLMYLNHTLYTGFRYGISAYLGAAVLIGLMLEALQPNLRLLLALIFLLLPVHALLRHVRPHVVPALVLAQQQPGDEPIVIEDPAEYMQTWWYSAPQTRARLHCVLLTPAEMQSSRGAPTMMTFILQSPLLPMHTESAVAFLAAHPRFLLINTDVGLAAPYPLQAKLQVGGYRFDKVAQTHLAFGGFNQTDTIYDVSR